MIKDSSLEKSGKFETLKGLLSPLNVDSDTDNEDGLTASDVEHQRALSAAIEHEADLSKEYELEREIFVASAIEHKAKLAKEKAAQEAYENAMKHDDNEEELVEHSEEASGNNDEINEDEKVSTQE